jgi:hypothetical protein
VTTITLAVNFVTLLYWLNTAQSLQTRKDKTDKTVTNYRLFAYLENSKDFIKFEINMEKIA